MRVNLSNGDFARVDITENKNAEDVGACRAALSALFAFFKFVY
jgi:hypothetical protein